MDNTTIISIADSVDSQAIDKATVSDGVVTLPGASVAVKPSDIQAEIADFDAQITAKQTNIDNYNSAIASDTADIATLQAKKAADQALLTTLLALPGVTS